MQMEAMQRSTMQPHATFVLLGVFTLRSLSVTHSISTTIAKFPACSCRGIQDSSPWLSHALNGQVTEDWTVIS